MYKHYIEIDENDMVTDAFSSAFRLPEGGEILVADTEERHFNLQLKDDQGILQYQWQNPDVVKIDIPPKTSEYHDWNGSEWVVNLMRAKDDIGAFVRNTTREILGFSSCIVHRHIDEIADGGSRRITDQLYDDELAHRRQIREYVDGRIVALVEATEVQDIMDIHDDIAGKLVDEKARYSC